jgi:hypothetical protein
MTDFARKIQPDIFFGINRDDENREKITLSV